jgi:hypothetical protein
MFPKFTMRSSTCSAYKHLTFIPYALANVVEDEGDFPVSEGHGYPLVLCNLFNIFSDLLACLLLANSVQFHVTSSSQIHLYDHICLQILCNFIDIFLSDHLAWSLLVDSVQFVNIFSDYCLQLHNFIDIFSDCLAHSCEFCAVLLLSSQIILHHHSLQIYSHLLRASCNITACIFSAIPLTSSQISMHDLLLTKC